MPSLLNHTLSKQNVTCNLLRTLEELIWMYIAVLGLKHPIKPEANQQKINLLHPADCLDLQMSLTFSPKYFLNNFQIYIFVNKMLGSNLVGQKPIYAAGKYSLRLWIKSCIMSELSAYKANWGDWLLYRKIRKRVNWETYQPFHSNKTFIAVFEPVLQLQFPCQELK